MNRGRWIRSLVIAFGLTLSPAWAEVEDASDGAEALNLPLTIDNVWYRTEKKRGVFGAKSRGDLTIAESSLDYSARKESFSLPLDTVHGVFLGKARGDVDTDWVLLRVGSVDAPQLIAFRDGTKFGYGQRTEEIYLTLRRAMRQLGAAQYRTQPGYVTYDRSGSVFVIALPETWWGARRSVERTEDGAPLGRTEFDDRDRLRGGGRLLPEGQRGEEILLERREISPRLSCTSFGERGTRAVRAWVEETITTRGATPAGAMDVQATRLAGCNGVRVKASLTDSGGRSRILEYRALAQLGVAYMLSFEASPESYDDDLRRFEQILSTFQISPTR